MFQVLTRVIVREWRRILTRPLYMFCIVAVPLFCTLFFATLLDEGMPSNLPIAIVDQDHTTTSRNIVRNLDAFQNTRIVAELPDVASARRAMQRGEIYAFYHIPAGTTHRLMRQESPKVAFYTNNTFLMAGSLLYKDMRMMSELAGGGAARKVLLARGATDQQATAQLQPIVVESYALGNPTLNYNVYLSNIFAPAMLSMMIFFITVFSIGQEVKDNTGRRLLKLAGGSAGVALAGKLIAQHLLFALMALGMGLYYYGYLDFPSLCGLPTLLLLLWLMVLASQGLGVLMIHALPVLRLGLSLASLWGVLSLSLCGLSFPPMGMPAMLQGFAALFPLRHYFLLYVNCGLQGHPITQAWPHLAALCLFALLPLLFVGRFRHLMTRTAYVP